MSNISLLVAVKNNLEYTKHFYQTTRAVYPEIEICFSSYGSTDGTHEWLNSLNDPFTKIFYSDEYGNFSDNYNKAASLSTKDYIAFIHNDIVLAPGFIENLEKHCSPDTVISYTTIEPPIFAGHERPGKIIKDFSADLETFNINGFYQFAAETVEKYKDKIEPGIVFFMCMPKDKYLEIGGLDNLYNPMFCEDDDLILRWKLAELNIITSLDAITYHFVSKTSRFSEEYQQHTQQIELQSNRNFIRKWGNKDFKTKYDIGYIIKNCNPQLIPTLELFASTIYVDCPYQDYIEIEQPNTKFDLNKRIKNINESKTNQILVEFDATQLNENNFHLLQQLPQIISESGEIGVFELDIFKLDISGIDRLEKYLIETTSPYYQSQLL
jgi:GT2 family glycosyltransferase